MLGHSCLKDRGYWIFLALTILSGVIIFSFRCDYQNYVSQGDHGRDLYTFKIVAEEGAIPYRDFSWLYGPFMVYFYAAVFKVFGSAAQAALVAQNVLIVLTGVILYLAGTRLFSPALSFVCALWYWAFRGGEFFHTYNHIGGLLCMVFMAYVLFDYARDARIKYVLSGLLAGFLLLLIRLNMGIVFLAGWVVCLFLADRVRGADDARRVSSRMYVYGAGVCLLLALLVYGLCLWGMPEYVFRQSFPFDKEQRTDGAPGIFSALGNLGHMMAALFLSSGKWKAVAVILAGSLAGTVWVFLRREKGVRVTAFFIGTLVILALAALHEYGVSVTTYRLYWAFPFILLLGFLMFQQATSASAFKGARILLMVALGGMAVTTIGSATRLIMTHRTPENLLQQGKTRIYTLQGPEWQATVRETCDFIEKNIPRDEALFTVPFDTLYNFLTARKQPTRQWTYFQHFRLSQEQERAVIADLENKKVSWVLMSNRAISHDRGLGVFGRDHCQVLGGYIFSHYDEAARFGAWTSKESWGWDHAVIILKRTMPFAGK